MAHSYVELSGNDILAKDSDIEWLCAFLFEAHKEHSAGKMESDKLDNLFEYWTTDEAFPGPGCTDLQLDDFLDDSKTKMQLILLLDEVHAKITAYGEYIPPEEMNRHVGLTEYSGYTANKPVVQMLGFLKKFRDLVEHSLVDDML
ncbi:hypothetical protein CA54_38680 [Symmachiella macrocystis]|uniref:Uncharacterized protein n=1 Tax=Symmachiella macrocystis TaxID=2527985 RepID=A0A5C6BDX4_9PLAN|nr:hypothetical protein [Symmachiella macrocystis]TWU08634.1 hypothetical protein CA54_38680 [Symmachiella macrocystis]